MTARDSDEPKKVITEHFREYLSRVTSTLPADRPRAEAAAKRLAVILKIKTNEVTWVFDPQIASDEFLKADNPAMAWEASMVFADDVIGISEGYSNEEMQLLEELDASCFAAFIMPGKIILCDRPAMVGLRDGYLVPTSWRSSI